MSYNQNSNSIQPMNNSIAKQNGTKKNQVQVLKNMVNSPAMQSRFMNALGSKERASSFLSSVVGAVSVNPSLQNCDPTSVLSAAMVSATLNLSVVPTLGQAGLVPYAGKVQFQIMVRGLIQLAQRTRLYKNLNCDKVYEDEFEGIDLLTGDLKLKYVTGGQRDRGEENKVVGYFAHFDLVNGFSKTEYMTKGAIKAHAQRFSKSYDKGPWQDNFDAMAKKTVMKFLLNHYGPLSVEMERALVEDQAVFDGESESYEDNPQNDEAFSNNIEVTPEETTAPVAKANPAPKKEQQPSQEEIDAYNAELFQYSNESPNQDQYETF